MKINQLIQLAKTTSARISVHDGAANLALLEATEERIAEQLRTALTAIPHGYQAPCTEWSERIDAIMDGFSDMRTDELNQLYHEVRDHFREVQRLQPDLFPEPTMSIQILNQRTKPQGEYIGRPTPLGNPFSVEKYGRDQAISMYKTWLANNIRTPAVRNEIIRLARIYKEKGTLNLICWCHPLPCHGEVVAKAIQHFAAQM